MTAEVTRHQELESAARSARPRVIAVPATAVFLFAALYSLFTFLHTRFPYLQAGADLVTRFKHDLARNGHPFQNTRGLHIMAFGNSKIMSGFIPSLFDRQMGAAGIPGVESYNFGLPGDDRFAADLELMVARGTAPDVVLLAFPWPAAESASTLFHFAANDQEIMDRLFPFRRLFRDFFIMATEAHGSPSALRRLYPENERTGRQVEMDRGYYFIIRQSHYPNHQLPPDLSDPTDTPEVLQPRKVSRGPVFERLVALFATHHIQCLFVPLYYREGQFAQPAPLNVETARTLADQANFGIAGPDYFLYPNRLFSDFTHTNPRGAEVYTRDVAGLVAQWVQQAPFLRQSHP